MDIEKLILKKIDEIEETRNIKVLHAVESGSRAWGFASPDSDYDVRFVYVRQMEAYLSLQPQKDFIDWELNETLDINGWDLSKALRHFYKSNAALFEWTNSPIVYKTTDTWQKIRKVAEGYFSVKSVMYHYYGTANSNYHQYLTDDMVKYKKYFYVLRPLLACKWIERYKTAPPVLFSELSDKVLDESLRTTVEKLVEMKKQMSEAEKGRRIENINSYITKNLHYFKNLLETMVDDRNKDWEGLDNLFKEIIM